MRLLTASDLPDTIDCFRAHMGLWAIEPLWLQQAIMALQIPQAFDSAPQPMQPAALDRPTYGKAGDTAVIRLVGTMQKGQSKFGGTSTIQARRALREAAADKSIANIMLAIDSPGGQVAGTAELADEVKAISARKPIAAYLEDLGASAAYWVASQAQRVTANRTAEVGSIGVLAVLEDQTGRAERAGIKVHVVSTGPYKGMGIPGATVLPEHLSEVQSRVDALAQHFFEAVRIGRKLSQAQLEAVTDGRVYSASQATALRLIDGVETFDAAVAALQELKPRRQYSIKALTGSLATE